MHKIKSKFKHIKKLLKNNTKLKVRFLVGSSSLLLLVIGVTTYFATYSDLILEFNDDPDYVESSVKDNKVIINEQFETNIKGLYSIGDGGGMTRGLMMASCSGIQMARNL